MHNIVILFENTDLKECMAYVNDWHKKINSMGISVTIGISEETSGFGGISTSYNQTNKAIEVSVLLGRNKVIGYSEYKKIMNQNNIKKEIDWDEFLEAIINCKMKNVENHLNDYIEVIKDTKIPDEEYLKLMTMTMIMRAGSTLNKYGINLYELISEEKVFSDVRGITSLKDVSVCTKKYIETICEYHNQKKAKRNTNVIKDALEYVNRNLYNSKLSLKKAATDLYTNESYLSREFKKAYGMSFVEYVSRKRIDASKKLLKETNLKVYEVAEKIGFKDAHYFCICFKKQTGQTIKEYRGA